MFLIYYIIWLQLSTGRTLILLIQPIRLRSSGILHLLFSGYSLPAHREVCRYHSRGTAGDIFRCSFQRTLWLKPISRLPSGLLKPLR